MTLPAPDPLCPHLQPLLAAELAAGNVIASVGPAMSTTPGSMVLLRRPFLALPAKLPNDVDRVAIDDPHWWKEELRCAAHHHVLACGFA